MTTLTEAWELSRDDKGLAAVATLRGDGTIQSSVVNTAVLGDRSCRKLWSSGRDNAASHQDRERGARRPGVIQNL